MIFIILIYFYKNIILCINNIIKINIYGDWGLGIGDWGLGIGPNPQSPNPQSPIPNPQSPYIYFNNIIYT